ncbi:hypothetical protein B0H11DRAFT_1898284 [Mycena galericulata]|nr:hypothetical protein B0H11DRAFT_1898284 [Mycena galericulata]
MTRMDAFIGDNRHFQNILYDLFQFGAQRMSAAYAEASFIVKNNAQGVYVADPAPPPTFNSSAACFAYFDQAANTPSVLVNTTGLFKKNVDFLTGILFRSFRSAQLEYNTHYWQK